VKFANCPVAPVFPRVPGALLRVKIKSLTACPELLIAAAESRLEIVTESEPSLVVKAALAETALSPDPLAPLKVINTAAAG